MKRLFALVLTLVGFGLVGCSREPACPGIKVDVPGVKVEVNKGGVKVDVPK